MNIDEKLAYLQKINPNVKYTQARILSQEEVKQMQEERAKAREVAKQKSLQDCPLDYIYDDGGQDKQKYKSNHMCFLRAIAIYTKFTFDEVAEVILAYNKRKYKKRSLASYIAFDEKELKKRFGLKKVYDYANDYKLDIDEIYRIYGNCIIISNHHAHAIIDGAIRDTWDSRRRKGSTFSKPIIKRIYKLNNKGGTNESK